MNTALRKLIESLKVGQVLSYELMLTIYNAEAELDAIEKLLDVGQPCRVLPHSKLKKVSYERTKEMHKDACLFCGKKLNDNFEIVLEREK